MSRKSSEFSFKSLLPENVRSQNFRSQRRSSDSSRFMTAVSSPINEITRVIRKLKPIKRGTRKFAIKSADLVKGRKMLKNNNKRRPHRSSSQTRRSPTKQPAFLEVLKNLNKVAGKK